MNLLQTWRALGPIDLRSIRRDSALSWMVFLPLFSALILRWGLPALTERLLARYAFDLAPYYPALLGYFFVIMTPITFAVLIGFLLLDEKDDQTLTALRVTPLSLQSYLAYRISVPVLLTLGLLFIIFPLSRLDDLPWVSILLVGLAAAPLSPMFALFLAALAQNKVQGFALMKLAGAVLVVPVFAFFVQSPWELAFGLIPTYWPMKTYWMLTTGQTAGIGWHILMAILYQGALAVLFTRRWVNLP